MSAFLTVDEFDTESLVGLLTPKKRKKTFLEFVRTMKLPDGPLEGKQFRPETEPTQMHFINAVDSGKWRNFVFIAPSQRGKTTLAILATWLYSIVEEGYGFGYVLPNMQKLDQVWMSKLQPGVKGSGYGSWLPTSGPGSKNGRPAALSMQDPITKKIILTYFMAAGLGGRETALSAVSPARLGIDEIDDFESAGQVELALKRLQSWGKRGRAFLASTVNSRAERDGHPVLDFHTREDATGCRVAHRCQHCGWYQIPEFAQFNLDEGRFCCSHCGVIWSDIDRRAALEESKLAFREGISDGKVIESTRKCEYFTLLSTFGDFNMGDISGIPAMYRAAQDAEKLGKYDLMELFSHKVLCVPYTIPVDHETITDRMLTLRSTMSKCGKGIVPQGADRIVIGVDVQGDRCYWVAVASGSADRRWIIDYDEWFWKPKDPVTGRPMEPTDDDRHAVLNRVLQRGRDGWEREIDQGDPIKASLVAIDIGFNPNGSIGRWVYGKAGIVAVKGDHEDRVVAETLQGKINTRVGKGSSALVSDHGFFEVRKQEHTQGQPGMWWFVKSQSMREHVAGRLRLPFDSEGSLMLPHGIAERDFLIQHLSAWAIVREHDSKLVKWVQVRKRDDYGDATNYAIALLSQTKKASPVGGVVGKINPQGTP